MVFAIMVASAAINLPLAASDAGPVLPAPTGKYAVGRFTQYFLDMSRDDERGTQKDHKREFMAQIWYPAKPGSKGKPAPWLLPEWAHFEENANLIGRPLKRPAKETGDFLASVVCHSQEGVPLASSPKRFPVILLAPGSLSFPSEYSTFAEELASHGFVVVGDVATGQPTVSFPAGNVTRLYRGFAIFDLWEGDLKYEMDQLEAWNKTKGHLFYGRLDLDHIGAFGHSAGGMIVSKMPLLDRRVKAVALLDPGIVVPEQGQAVPVLIFKSDHKDDAGSREKARTETAYVQRATPGIQMKLIGGDHVNFGDLPLFMTFAKAQGDSKAYNDTVRTVLREFFGQSLLGKHSELLVKGSDKYPLLKIEKNPEY